MKKLLFLTILILLVSNVFAQTYIDGVDLSSIKTPYLEVQIYNQLSGIHAAIDYGQGRNRNGTGILKDISGNKLKFYSTIDVLNFMYKNGWELVSNCEPQAEDRFILKRRKR